jgi:mannitol-1-phosphate 5-dehydrogenase
VQNQKKLVIFGAGKIGRSFIGQVFGRAGYDVVFVDVNEELVKLLNHKGEYRVIIKSNTGEQAITIENTRALHIDDEKNIISELADATLAAISVGQQGLPGTIPIIAKGLIERRKKHGLRPLDIIIAENMRNTDLFIQDKIKPLLPDGFPLNEMLGLVETSIGKMVPIMTQKDLQQDPLQVFAEPYNTLIVARKGFKNPIPQIQDLAPKENIKAWVDRKLFIHNLGHSALAYLGYRKNKGYQYIYQAVEDDAVRRQTQLTMQQSAKILMSLYPEEFSINDLDDHINDLLARFANRALGDTLFRVGSDLYRKLGPDDRFTAPISAAIKLNLPFNMILDAFVAGISFQAVDENGRHFQSDPDFFREAENGIAHILHNISGFSEKEIQHLSIQGEIT